MTSPDDRHRTSPEPAAPQSVVGMALFNETDTDLTAMGDYFAGGGLPAEAVIEFDPDEDLTVCLAGVSVIVLPAPSPVADAADRVHMYHRPEDLELLRQHRGHCVVAAMDAAGHETSPFHRLLVQSVVVAALMSRSDAAGFYLGDANTVFPAALYNSLTKRAKESGQPATELFYDLRVGSTPSGISGYTQGLSAIGHRDLAIVDSTRQAEQVRDVLAGTADYLFHGGQLQVGESVGLTADDNFLVQRAPSPVHEGDIFVLAETPRRD